MNEKCRCEQSVHETTCQEEGAVKVMTDFGPFLLCMKCHEAGHMAPMPKPTLYQCEAILSGRCENIECPHAELHIPHGDELAMEYLGKQYKDVKCDTADICKSEDIRVKCVVPPEEDEWEDEEANDDPGEAKEWFDYDPDC